MLFPRPLRRMRRDFERRRVRKLYPWWFADYTPSRSSELGRGERGPAELELPTRKVPNAQQPPIKRPRRRA